MKTIDITKDLINQLMVNKYSGFKTVFINEREYEVIKRTNNNLTVKEV